MRYAKTTKVPVERSRAEIEKTLVRYGAKRFFFSQDIDRISIGFELEGFPILFRFDWPEDPREQRQRMRVALLVIKSKLELVGDEISTVAAEFLAYIVAGEGRTVGDEIVPQIIGGARRLALPYPEGGQ